MKSLTKHAKRFLKEDNGPTATEYAVMLALITVLCVGAITAIGIKIDTTITNLDVSRQSGPAS